MPLLTPATTEASPPVNSNVVIADRVRGEFREMPGLTLTSAQAGRLWSLDGPTCESILTQLVETGFLCQKANGAFCKA